MFLSKEERVALALKRRQEKVETQRQREQEERGARLRYLEDAQHSSRDRRWESSEQVDILAWHPRRGVTGLSAIFESQITVLPLQDRGERDRQREETLNQKDKEKEMDAIKVSEG